MILLGLRGFPGGSDGKAFCLQCGRPGFNPWARKIPWRRKWQPTAVLLTGKFHGWRILVGRLHTVHGITKSQTRLSTFTGPIGPRKIIAPTRQQGQWLKCGLALLMVRSLVFLNIPLRWEPIIPILFSKALQHTPGPIRSLLILLLQAKWCVREFFEMNSNADGSAW